MIMNNRSNRRRGAPLLAAYLAGVASAFACSALAARVVGEPGYLLGWEVSVDGETVCSDPYVWPITQEIECE